MGRKESSTGKAQESSIPVAYGRRGRVVGVINGCLYHWNR